MFAAESSAALIIKEREDQPNWRIKTPAISLSVAPQSSKYWSSRTCFATIIIYYIWRLGPADRRWDR